MMNDEIHRSNGFLRKLHHIFLHSDLLFVILFIIVAAFYYDSIMHKGPLGVHQWRQTDCLSITYKYYQGAPFFEPEMQCQLGNDYTTGKTAGEFPLLYYLSGMIWKLTGVNYMSFRIFYLILLFTGMFALFRATKHILHSNFWALVVTGLVFTSPAYVYYGISFLTDGPAMAFVFMALYCIVQYKRTNKPYIFFLSMLFFALGGLVKVSSMMAFLFFCFVYLLELFPVKTLGKEKLFHTTKFEWLGFLLVILSVLAWYVYAEYYNNITRFKYTFNSIHPYWLMKASEVETVVERFKNFASHMFHNRAVWALLIFTGIYNLMLLKKIPMIAWLGNITILLGSALYFVLWAPLLGHHDYYYVILVIIVPAVLIPFLIYMKTNANNAFNDVKTKVIVVVFLLYSFLYCLDAVRLKTLSNSGMHIFIGNHKLVEELRWINWEVGANWHRYKNMRPYLEQIGVKKSDKVIVLPDFSFNTSLWYLGLDGWTNFQKTENSDDIQKLIDKGARYLIIGDSMLLKERYLWPFLKNKAGEFEGIFIFRLFEE
jgi:hypothetical protein